MLLLITRMSTNMLIELCCLQNINNNIAQYGTVFCSDVLKDNWDLLIRISFNESTDLMSRTGMERLPYWHHNQSHIQFHCHQYQQKTHHYVL